VDNQNRLSDNNWQNLVALSADFCLITIITTIGSKTVTVSVFFYLRSDFIFFSSLKFFVHSASFFITISSLYTYNFSCLIFAAK
jgi:hypothetical protein